MGEDVEGKMDEVGPCAYSAGPPEEQIMMRGRGRGGGAGEGIHLSVSKGSSLIQTVQLTHCGGWRGGTQPCGYLSEKETLVVCLDCFNVFGL